VTARASWLAILGLALVAVTPALAADPAPELGRSAPGFTLPDLAGTQVRLADYQGKKAVLINFWATWCAPCREEMPALETLARELGPRGLTVVGVNFKESRRAVEAFRKALGLGFPMLLDGDGRVSVAYQVFALPVTVLVDRRGMLAGTVLGVRDWVGPDARAYLGRLLVEPEA
jgi:peroxiredoxin